MYSILCRKENMHSGKMIFTICAFANLALSAYPTHRDTREASWTDSKANEAHAESKLTKEADKIYKSLIDDSGLYNHEDEYNKNPVSEQMQRKILVESERLRARLRQELAELRERLAPSPAHLASALASMREHLAPFTLQLHNNTHSLCHQLRLYLRDPDAAEARQGLVVHHWMTRTLERSGSNLTDILADFMAKTREVTERLREMSEAEAANADIWQRFSSRLGREVTSLKAEAQNSLETLKVQLADQLETAQPLSAMVEHVCQNAAQQHRDFQARIETLFTGMEEELEVQSISSYSEHTGGSLKEDFFIKLSALIQDILHSVQ
ncbi:apolipoprotein A-IV isoform X2 [Phycodurus eques]|uniref:apolipoprotein A-IV isoform X2 n=1 Tax=Phycodurus eques TaxID=693459 RepID=UPI002ACEC1EE|nr:apolipoprotein A-IV isoform X2 [Phycodurus eques]